MVLGAPQRIISLSKEEPDIMSESNKCCEKCRSGFTQSPLPEYCINCHCHSTTPSWELQLRDSLQNEWGTDYRVSDSFDNWIVEKVATLLSQTLSNERQRMVAIGEGLRKPTSDEDEWGIAVMKQYFNEAITTYQQKIKSLDS